MMLPINHVQLQSSDLLPEMRLLTETHKRVHWSQMHAALTQMAYINEPSHPVSHEVETYAA